MPDAKLGYQLIKYQSRNGWSHKDVMRLAHPQFKGNKADIAKWLFKGGEVPDNKYIQGYVACKESANDGQVIFNIKKYGLTREMIPTESLQSASVWESLLYDMPMTAMIRNLGKMSSLGLITPLSSTAKHVIGKLGDAEAIKSSRVHPIALLTAMNVYKSGAGVLGKLSWNVNPAVVSALEDSFYKAFDFVEPTGKGFCLGIDVSGSMGGGQVAGSPGLTPCMGAAAMAMLIIRTEPNHFVGGFSQKFVNLGITAKDRLDVAMRKARDNNFGGTDASIAITHATKNKFDVDAFVTISDGESWAGSLQASEALSKYRRILKKPDAKLICINMIANHTTMADSKDTGSLNVAGFDTSVPTIINSFVGGNSHAFGWMD